jgi:predicted RNase H-like nuclease (RuvC/YqgF family)
MILEEMYSMREPFRRYTVEEKLDTDVLCVDIEHWKKENDELHKKACLYNYRYLERNQIMDDTIMELERQIARLENMVSDLEYENADLKNQLREALRDADYWESRAEDARYDDL